MIWHWIELHNIANHRDTRVEFDGHSLVVIVAPNETGKSYLIGAPFALMFGTFPAATPKKIYKDITWGEKEAYLAGEGTNPGTGIRYRMRRSLKVMPKTQTQNGLIEELLPNGTWHPIAGPNISEFEQKIKALFGDPKTYLAASLSAQDGVGDITIADKTKRYDVLIDLLGAQDLLPISSKADELRKKLNTQAEQLRGQLETLSSDSTLLEENEKEESRLKLQIEKVNQNIIDAEKEMGALSEQINVLETQHHKKDAIRKEVEEKKQEHAELLRTLRHTQAELAEAREAANTLPPLLAKQNRLEAARIEQVEMSKQRDAYHAWQIADQNLRNLQGQVAQKAADLSGMNNELANYEEVVINKERHASIEKQLNQLYPEKEKHLKDQEKALKYDQWRGGLEQQRGNLQAQHSAQQPQVAVLDQIPDANGICQTCPLARLGYEAQKLVKNLNDQIQAIDDILTRSPRPAIQPFDLETYRTLETEWAGLAYASQELARLENVKQLKEVRQKELNGLQEELSKINVIPVNFNPQSYQALELEIRQIEPQILQISRLDTMSRRIPEIEQRQVQDIERCDNLNSAITALNGQLLDDHLIQKLEHSRELRRQAESRNLTFSLSKQNLHVELGAVQQRIKIANRIRAQITEIKPKLLSLERRVRLQGVLRQVFSKKGAIPLLIDQRAKPGIESYAKTIMESVMDIPERLEIKTQTNSGREDLDVAIHNEHGRHEIDQFSSAKRRILRMAIRMAIVCWTRSIGRPCGDLGIDEAFDNLDSANVKKVIQLIKYMAESASKVQVISHNDDVSSEFPEALYLENTPDGVTTRWA